jgi:hypothetical protein
MMRSAVADKSSSIGPGSALIAPNVDLLEFNMTPAPRENSLCQEFCKRRAIVYNDDRADSAGKFAALSERYQAASRLLIRCATTLRRAFA